MFSEDAEISPVFVYHLPFHNQGQPQTFLNEGLMLTQHDLHLEIYEQLTGSKNRQPKDPETACFVGGRDRLNMLMMGTGFNILTPAQRHLKLCTGPKLFVCLSLFV